MKIDHEYLRKVLESFEAAKLSTTNLDELEENGLPRDEEHLHKLAFHMELLEDQGMIESVISDGIGFTRDANGEFILSIVPLRLTASGHDFLADIRQEGVWETLRSKFHDASVDTTVSIAKKLATAAAVKMIEGWPS